MTPVVTGKDCASKTDRHEDVLDIERRQLRQHIGLSPEPGDLLFYTP